MFLMKIECVPTVSHGARTFPNTRNPVIPQDLLKHTPVDHPDYPLLQDALRISQNFLSSINEDIDPRRTAVTTPKGEVSSDPA